VIITVTLNPAIDQTIEIDRLEVGDTNRVVASRFDIGGKGINVSRVLKELHFEPLAMGFAPGDLGRMIEDQLTDSGIGCDFVYVGGETRTNVTIIDRSTHVDTVLSGPGAGVSERDIERLLRRLRRRLVHDSWLVLAGSIPPPGDPTIYVRLVQTAQEQGSLVGVDADGPVVQALLRAEAFPALIKLNDHELARVADQPVHSEADAVRAAKAIRDRGVRNVVVTRGARPAIALTSVGDFRVEVPEVNVVSAVGAGDAFLAGLLLGLKHGEGWQESLRLAAAAGAACCLEHGTQLCHETQVVRLRPGVQVSELSTAGARSGSR
jgi:1-phosphofructokinase family hexose kinase